MISLSDLRKMSDADIISGISEIVYNGELCRLEEPSEQADYEPKAVPGNDFRQLREFVDELEYRHVIRESLRKQVTPLQPEAAPPQAD